MENKNNSGYGKVPFSRRKKNAVTIWILFAVMVIGCVCTIDGEYIPLVLIGAFVTFEVAGFLITKNTNKHLKNLTECRIVGSTLYIDKQSPSFYYAFQAVPYKRLTLRTIH